MWVVLESIVGVVVAVMFGWFAAIEAKGQTIIRVLMGALLLSPGMAFAHSVHVVCDVSKDDTVGQSFCTGIRDQLKKGTYEFTEAANSPYILHVVTLRVEDAEEMLRNGPYEHALMLALKRDGKEYYGQDYDLDMMLPFPAKYLKKGGGSELVDYDAAFSHACKLSLQFAGMWIRRIESESQPVK
jgi:hypothetical protein